ncbi:probable cytochrome P450 49a1 isoform X2 [Procambarus clarkii]|nr:probable cytochrome P450 49a1 isoform X2 [Procambarus clarkii]
MLGGVRCGLVRILRPSSPSLSRALTISAAPRQATAPAAEQQTSAPRSVWEVPGPRVYPLIGCLPSFLLDKSTRNNQVHLFFHKMLERYGPIVKFISPLNPPILIIAKPDDAETLIRATMDNPIRDGFTSLEKIRKEAADNYFENKTGLLTENGEEWWRVRSRVQTSMMKVREVLSYLPVMDQISMEFMNRIASLQSQFGEMPHDFQNEIYKWALESVGSVALNRRLGCLDPNIAADSEPMKLIKLANEFFSSLSEVEFSSHLWMLVQTPSFRRLKKTHEEFLEIADKNIRETEAALQARTASGGQGEMTLMEALLLKPGLSRKDVVTLILDMLIAGIDTTSHTLAFTLYLLARNPEVQKRLQEEVDTVLGDHTGSLTPNHLAQLSYLKAVVKESMRVFPIVFGTGRVLQKDVVLRGFLIPKGWSVVALSMTTGWDESEFPRAKEFLPDRWLRHQPLGPIHPYASLPFGGGTRMCIGRRIAEQELYTFLARAMQRFTVDYKYQDMEVICRMVLTPSRPLKFTFTQRN